MDIASFLPEYPRIESDGFYQEIYDREEFRELQLAPTEPIPTVPGQYMNHQKIVQRFLSPFTTFDRILLMWEMGSGKTCAAVSIAEGVFAQPELGINSAIYLARSDDLYKKFKIALAEECTAGIYLPPGPKSKYSEKSWVNLRSRRISKRYQTETFETFVTHSIANLSADALRRKFSNKVFILDEIHNLKDTGQAETRQKKGKTQKITTAKIYNGLLRLFEAVENVKIVFLSGTPMTNNAEEIGAIMQLLTGDRSIPTRGDFVAEFMATNENGILEVREDKLPELQQIFRGRVSYLRAPSIPTEFRGERIGDLQHFLVSPDPASEHQLRSYTQAYAKDTGRNLPDVDTEEGAQLEASGIFNASRQAALMVYPDGSWGRQGFEKYIKGSDSLFTGKPTVEDVYRLSSKYGTILRQLLDMREGRIPRRKMFIFCKYLEGSGLLAFGEILSKFGWKRASSTAGTNGDYFAIISGSRDQKGQNINRLISSFNSPNNVQGERLQILMGTEKLAEGYDLYDCDICHILTPHWNYAQTEQAIARIKRMGRHRRLAERQGSEVVVKVWQHCMTTPDNNPVSIDLKMYETSEKKDVAIAKMRRLLKEAAVDCQLTYARNFRPGEQPFSRECDYMECEYKCNGITDVGSTNVSSETWQLYYADTEAIKELLVAVLRVRFSVTIPEALEFIRTGTDRINPAKVTVHALLRVVTEMIDTVHPVEDMYGFHGYIAVESDRIFLTPNPYGNPMETDTEYLRRIPVTTPVDIQQYIVPSLYHKLLTTRELSVDKRQELLEFLSKPAQEKLLEDIVLSRRNNPGLNIPGREALYNIFSGVLITEPGKITSTLLYDPDTKTGARCLIDGSNEWEDCELDSVTLDLTIEQAEAAAREMGLGFYGKIVGGRLQQGDFKIVNFGGGGSKRGRVCDKYPTSVLYGFAASLGVENPGRYKSIELCERLKQKMIELGLVARE